MKSNSFTRVTAAVAIMAILTAGPAHTMGMQEVFDNINAEGNVSTPGMIQGQTMNMYTGGSLFMRMPKRTYQLVNVAPPSYSAGCGGIDLFMGGFSFINKDQFVAMLRNIGSNALGYGFKLAIQNLCPTCDNVMQALQATANFANRLNIDSCEAAKGIVNASVPESWEKGKQQAARGFGVDGNLFENVTDAWTKVGKSLTATNDAVQTTKSSHPEIADKLPTGNVVWKALKKLNGIDDDQRMFLMSMIGTVVFPTSGSELTPKTWPGYKYKIEDLIGKNGSENLEVEVYRCTDTNECLSYTTQLITTKSFGGMVQTKLGQLADDIASRRANSNTTEMQGFLNAVDLPIYKLIAVSTSSGNTGMADYLTGRYKELIAAKYAEVYISTAVRDLRGALDHFERNAETVQAAEVARLKVETDDVVKEARKALADAYSRTTNATQIANEVSMLERTMHANLSQTVRTSYAFGKSVR